ncbi:hypothetical protein CYMTET_22215 [Cymbomonas tetramitiformis]|uniref:KilA-N domain-containing protein n=1 Tax=Cymbomonas tetramitiformis TaxID=36881 RepID=A0AAE0G0V8_9CHLO|nr:hypothetical protein CYMTET_22215 [Cymbomonas tetramitiformis]
MNGEEEDHAREDAGHDTGHDTDETRAQVSDIVEEAIEAVGAEAVPSRREVKGKKRMEVASVFERYNRGDANEITEARPDVLVTNGEKEDEAREDAGHDIDETWAQAPDNGIAEVSVDTAPANRTMSLESVDVSLADHLDIDGDVCANVRVARSDANATVGGASTGTGEDVQALINKVRNIATEEFYFWDSNLQVFRWREDMYIDVTAYFHSIGKRMDNFLSTKQTTALISEYNERDDIKPDEVIKKYLLGNRGHPHVFVHPSFFVHVMKWAKKSSDNSNRTTLESNVRDKLAAIENGTVEVRTPSGFIDVLTDTEVIEVKHISSWKQAVGQVCCYALHYPKLDRRVHLFGTARDIERLSLKTQGIATAYGVRMTFEIVTDDSIDHATSSIQNELVGDPTEIEENVSSTGEIELIPLATFAREVAVASHTDGDQCENAERTPTSEDGLEREIRREQLLLKLETLKAEKEQKLTEQAASRAEREKYAKLQRSEVVDAKVPPSRREVKGKVYEFQPELNTDVCLNNKFANAHTFCANNNKRWENFLTTARTQDTISELEARLEMPKGSLIERHSLGRRGHPSIYVHPALFMCLAAWISPAKRADAALVYERYSRRDMTLAKEIVELFDVDNGTHTTNIAREGRPGSDNEWVVHQQDEELTRKRAREDVELDAFVKAQKRKDEEHEEKMALARAEREEQIALMRAERERKCAREDVAIVKAQKREDEEHERKMALMNAENEEKIALTRAESKRKCFDLVKGALESCFDIPGLTDADRNAYRAHIYNGAMELTTMTTTPNRAPRRALPAPAAGPTVNVTTLNTTAITDNNGGPAVSSPDDDVGGPAANAIAVAAEPPAAIATPVVEMTWEELWRRQSTDDNLILTLSGFLSDPKEDTTGEWRRKMHEHRNVVNRFGMKLAKRWREAHPGYELPKRVQKVRNVDTGFPVHTPVNTYYEADRELMREVAAELLRGYN